MLDNTITLPVDELNNGTPVWTDFIRFDEFQNRSVYNGPGHTLASKDTMSLYRTMPKASGNFKGVAKTAIKFSTDMSVPGIDGNGYVASVLIGEISFSVPVGTSAAQALILRQKMVAILDDDATMARLMEKLEV